MDNTNNALFFDAESLFRRSTRILDKADRYGSLRVAKRMIIRSAELGHSEARLRLIRESYTISPGRARYIRIPVETLNAWLKELIEAGNSEALDIRDRTYTKGMFNSLTEEEGIRNVPDATVAVPTDDDREELFRRAEEGDPQAMFDCSELEEDFDRSVQYVLRSAEAGFVPAMSRAAEYYANGLGVEKSVPTAMEWLRKAAEGGDVDAQFDLGTRYEFGGPYWKKSVEESLHWYRAAAEQGDIDAWERLYGQSR